MSASRLARPHSEFKDSYHEALLEYHAEDNFQHIRPLSEMDAFETFIQTRLSEDGADHAPLPDWSEPVKETILWLVKDQTYIGECAIRHRINWHLEKHGGHFSYIIRPSYRNRGFGKKLLQKALPVMASFGIERALLTTAPTNAASIHLIEICGGVFDEETVETEQFPARRKYWLRTD